MGGVPARSARAYRLDPELLRARSTVTAGGARPFTIDLGRGLVVLGQHRGGVVPFVAYRGVSVRMERLADGPVRVLLELLHADGALTVPLSVAEDCDSVVADWQEWGRLLRLPLLIIAADGTVTAPLSTLGALLIFPPKMRRRSRVTRRPRFLVRRRVGRAGAYAHIAGREMIAPD